MIVKIFTREF